MIGSDVACRNGRRNAFTLVELLVVVAIIALLVSILLPSLGRAKEHAYRVRCLAHLQNLVKAHHVYGAMFNEYLPGPNGIVDMSLPNDPYGMLACTSTNTGLLGKAGVVTSPEMWMCPKVKLPCPGIWYETHGYPWGHEGWTETMIRENPYTYHFSYNARTFCTPDGADWIDNDLRSRNIDTFPEPSCTVLLAEENSGMIPWSSSDYQVLNDPYFCGPDRTEPRHLGMSQVGYLDGHADQIDPYINLWYDDTYCPTPDTDD